MNKHIREKGQQEYKKLFKEERNDRPTDTALDAMTIEHVFAMSGAVLNFRLTSGA
jgi:hypothetical protein